MLAKGLCSIHYHRALRGTDPDRPDPRTVPADERLWSKVEKTDNCWLWRGAADKHGYGTIRIAGRGWKAHRFAWSLSHGDPGAAVVCHRCDVPACVRPDHLFLGTQGDNVRDMRAKGRGRLPRTQGESNSQSRLTAPVILEVRRRVDSGERVAHVARALGLSAAHASKIARREVWTHLPEATP